MNYQLNILNINFLKKSSKCINQWILQKKTKKKLPFMPMITEYAQKASKNPCSITLWPGESGRRGETEIENRERSPKGRGSRAKFAFATAQVQREGEEEEEASRSCGAAATAFQQFVRSVNSCARTTMNL